MSSDSIKHNRATYQAIPIDANFPIGMSMENDQSSLLAPNAAQLHFHACMQFVCSHSHGICVIVGEDEIYVQPNDVLLIYPHVPHSVASISQQRELLPDSTINIEILFIDDDLLLSHTDEFPNDWQYPVLSSPKSSHCYFSQAKYPEICNMVRDLLKEMHIHKYGWKFCSVSRAFILLMLLERTKEIRQTPKTAMNSNPGAQAASSLPKFPDLYRNSPIDIRPALNYIRENYAERIYLSLLSDLCHLSIASFRRKFKESMGTTPLDYIHDVRIQKACTLLRGSNASILDVSLAVGFESISSFNRKFLSTMGMPPNKYRNTANKPLEDK